MPPWPRSRRADSAGQLPGDLGWCNNEQNGPAQGLIQAAYSAGTLLAGRPTAEVAAYFDDFELLPPGLVPVTDWPKASAPDQGS